MKHYSVVYGTLQFNNVSYFVCSPDELIWSNENKDNKTFLFYPILRHKLSTCISQWENTVQTSSLCTHSPVQ